MSSIGQLRTQVLVIGAGPVGLLAALRLREQGIDVRVVDQQAEQSAHSAPVVLHPQTARLLNDLGLAPTLYWRGRAVSRLAVYTDGERRAVLELPRLRGFTAGLLTLPQDVVRQTLINALLRLDVRVEWNTRLAVLGQDERSVWGRLVQHESAELASDGQSGPHIQAFDADYVIGADGYASTVREALGLRLVEQGPLTSFAFFDATTQPSGHDAALGLSGDSADAVYPLSDGMSRFSFQLASSLHLAPDGQMLRELLAARMPWYDSEVGACSWSGVAEFRRALVDGFGRGRVWLAGDAAHMTGPLGVQSLNVGLDEASELALRMADALRRPARRAFGADYDAKRSLQWRELLGLEPRASFGPRSPAWARHQFERLLPALPASEADLDDLLDQLRLTAASGCFERAQAAHEGDVRRRA